MLENKRIKRIFVGRGLGELKNRINDIQMPQLGLIIKRLTFLQNNYQHKEIGKKKVYKFFI